MKNVTKISVSGYAFVVEDEGYRILDNYLAKLKRYYAGQPGGMEIVEGIEERIAELLRERTASAEEVISTEKITEVLAIMGRPEDIEDEGGSAAAADFGDEKPRRRLYRDLDRKFLGGVCSGLAAYFRWDPVIFRLIFICGTLFAGLLWFPFGWFGPLPGILRGGSFFVVLYLVLWIIVPPARTVVERCKMRGENPDFSGIQQRVKKGISDVEQGIRRVGRESRGFGNELAHGIGRGLAICIGIVLLCIAIPLLITLALGGVIFLGMNHSLPTEALSLVALGSPLCLLHILALLVAGLPCIGLLYGGLSLIFNLKPKKFRPGLCIFLLWILSLIALCITGVLAGRPYYGGEESRRQESVITSTSDTLYIQLAPESLLPENHIYMSAGASSAKLGWLEGGKKSLTGIIYPEIRIVRLTDGSPARMLLTGSACGRNSYLARENAREALPQVQWQDSLLRVQPHKFTRQQRWQGHSPNIILYVPDGKEVVLTAPYRHHFSSSSPRIYINPDETHWKIRVHRWTLWGNHWEYRWDRWEDRWEDKWDRWEDRWDEKWDRRN